MSVLYLAAHGKGEKNEEVDYKDRPIDGDVKDLRGSA